MEIPMDIAVAQLELIPGHPDRNMDGILREIKLARKRDMDVIVFPEMAVPGYLLGDEWENDSFINDLMNYNDDIRAASKDLCVVWGSVYADSCQKGEDGRIRKYNAAYIVQDRKWVSNGVLDGRTYKTLMPKYREFDDERHFFSMLKLAQEQGRPIQELLQPFPIKIGGREVNLGLILCEDMWCDDYSVNPTGVLVQNGADVILDLSSSPWTWRKNDKRHRVVKSLLDKTPVPFVYCNATGVQNNGKNLFLFDGNSTVYNPNGSVLTTAQDYSEQTIDVRVTGKSGLEKTPPPPSPEQDTQELYNGLVYGIRHFMSALPSQKVVIGLSGGIDSAVSASLMAAAVGPENIFAVNMPSKFNSELTKGAAAVLARNLGVNYAIYPIQASVDLTLNELADVTFVRQDATHAETRPTVTPLTIENIQARDRGSRVLAALSASLGAVFTNNGNKTETAIGYATLYGDVDGAIAPLADLYKGEVYQLADYINRRSGSAIIPEEIINVVPSAELSADQDVTQGKGDPIKYPYHDKLLRAFIEFRRDPEFILQHYIAGTLEAQIQVQPGLIAHYFPTSADFTADLERMWKLYKNNYFKRIQSPPIIAVSRRAFGFDLREAQNGAYFTRGYQAAKASL